MALPDHMKIQRKKVYTERLTLHLDQPTMKALLKGFEVFRENYSTFSEYGSMHTDRICSQSILCKICEIEIF